MDPKELLKKFVGSFEKLDEMYCFRETDEIAYSLRSGELDELGRYKWRAKEALTEQKYLAAVYAKLPARFPPLYEQLVLSYRGAQVDLQSFSLLNHSPY